MNSFSLHGEGTAILNQVFRDIPAFYQFISMDCEKKLIDFLKYSEHNIEAFLNERPIDALMWHEQILCKPESTYRRLDSNFKSLNPKPYRPCTTSPATKPNKDKQANKRAYCYNCGFCKTPEQKFKTINRVIDTNFNFHSIYKYLRQKPKYTQLVGLKILSDFYSAKTAFHYFISKLMINDLTLESKFYKVGRNSLAYITNNNQPDLFTGLVLGSLHFKQLVSFNTDEIKEVFKDLEHFKVVYYSELFPYKEVINKDLINIYRIKFLRYNIEDFKVAYLLFNGVVPIASSTTSQILNLKESVNIGTFPYSFKSQSEVVIALPIRINPYLVLASVFGLSPQKAFNQFNVSVLNTVKSSTFCKECGSEAFDSIIPELSINLCLKHLMRRY